MARERNAEDLSHLAGVDFGSLLHVEPLVISDVNPLGAALASFLAAGRGEQATGVGVEEGVAAVELAARVVESIQQHDWDGGP